MQLGKAADLYDGGSRGGVRMLGAFLVNMFELVDFIGICEVPR